MSVVAENYEGLHNSNTIYESFSRKSVLINRRSGQSVNRMEKIVQSENFPLELESSSRSKVISIKNFQRDTKLHFDVTIIVRSA